MKSWKETLEKAVDVNTMLFQYEMIVKKYQRYCDDLEKKIRVLHECSHYAHGELSSIVKKFGDLGNAEKQNGRPLEDVSKEYADLANSVKEVKEKMEEIISRATNTEPTLSV